MNYRHVSITQRVRIAHLNVIYEYKPTKSNILTLFIPICHLHMFFRPKQFETNTTHPIKPL